MTAGVLRMIERERGENQTERGWINRHGPGGMPRFGLAFPPWASGDVRPNRRRSDRPGDLRQQPSQVGGLRGLRTVDVSFILPALLEANDPGFRPIKYALFPPLGLAALAGHLGPDDHATLQDEHVQ